MRDTASEPHIAIDGAVGTDTGVQPERLAATFVFDARTGSVVVSETCRRLFGLNAAAQTTLEALLQRIHPDDRSGFAATTARLLGGSGAIAEREFRVAGAQGERWVSAEMRLLRDEAGHSCGLGCVALDVTRRKSAELELAQTHAERDALAARLATAQGDAGAVLDAMPQMVWQARPDGLIARANARWLAFTAAAPEDHAPLAWTALVHPQDAGAMAARWAQALESGTDFSAQCRLRRCDGEYLWMVCLAAPFRNETGAVAGWTGSLTEIDALKLAEEQSALVRRELSHRIKNIFAVVASLATLSARSAPEARPIAEAVRARIEALGRAHDYVRPRSSDPADGIPTRDAPDQSVAGLLDALLAPYRDDGDVHIAISCDEAQVGQHAATALALVVHELATNAVKYGALSTEDGRLQVSCRVDGARYEIVWREEGGPRLAGPPTHEGFGTLLSQRAARAQLGAEIVHDWASDGLCVRLSIPLDRLAV